MNNSYNYSFLISSKPSLETQHIAFEKSSSEESSNLTSPHNLPQEKLKNTTLNQEL